VQHDAATDDALSQSFADSAGRIFLNRSIATNSPRARKEASAPPSPRHKKSFHAFGQCRCRYRNGTGGGAEPFHYRITCKHHSVRSDNSYIQYL
jgi:hypothetical protein